MKTASLDIETNYVGEFSYPDDRLFRDFKNHQITVLGVRVIGQPDTLVPLVNKDVSTGDLLRVSRWGAEAGHV
jgi:hypothetical protein